MDKILIIDDKHAILESLEMFFAEKGYRVYKADTGATGMALFNRHEPDVVILDIRLPDTHGIALLEQIQALEKPAKVIMITAFQDMETTIAAMKLGAYDYIHKPLDVDKVEQAVERALYTLKIDRETPLPAEITQPPNPEVIIGKSDQMRHIFKTIGLLSQNRAPVLIQGETGTGKELIARCLHGLSTRRAGPFIAINCAAIQNTMLESELFGHEKGAFTHAITRKRGKFEIAHGGTLFLDEVGDMSLKTQAKVLRVLEEGKIERVGGHQCIPVNVRVIAASNKNLFQEIKHNRFREDLFYRLNVIPIHLPPLRDRIGDILELVNYFLTYFSPL